MRYDWTGTQLIADPGTTDISFTVPNVGTLVEVSFYVTHTYVSDLSVSIVPPDNNTHQILYRVGGTQDDFGTGLPDNQRTRLRDDAAVRICDAPMIDEHLPGVFRPCKYWGSVSEEPIPPGTPFGSFGYNDSPLAQFGSQSAGTWKVRFIDYEGGDQGTVRGVSLIFADPPDTTGPTVEITSPADGATVVGTTSVTATASDSSGVANVTFQIDGTPIATDTTDPYSTTLDSTLYSDGSHTLTAVATDSLGNIASDSITVIFDNVAPAPYVPDLLGVSTAGRDYSGVIINQNASPEDTQTLSTYLYQDFFLPEGFERAGEKIPELSGFQLRVVVPDGLSKTIKLPYELTVAGVSLASGIAIGAPSDGDVWMNAFFDRPVSITDDILESKFTLRFTSVVGGVEDIWYSEPNPYEFQGVITSTDGTTAITDGGDQIALCFRVLALVADSGTDFLGNSYRAAVMTADPSNVTTSGGNPDAFWLSKPNPSKFAVESLYFDISVGGRPTRIDKVYVDPLTPGVYMNVYYSSEGNPGTTEEEWDNKLWLHAPKTIRLTERQVHALPEPVSAKYIKLEFTYLQARYYAPGVFQQPTTYKKFPKWVLDYFLAVTITERVDNFVAGRVNVVYDALDLAYNYYLDDLRQHAVDPSVTINDVVTVTSSWLENRTDASDRVDPETLSRINLTMQPYRDYLVRQADANTLLGSFVRATTDAYVDQPVERDFTSRPLLDQVSTMNRDSVVFQEQYPVMFFYLTARHGYRINEALFENDRAYFVGIRELAFHRNNYLVHSDSALYDAGLTDEYADINDFIDTDGLVWTAPS